MLANNYGGANSITVRLEYVNAKGMLAKILKKMSESAFDIRFVHATENIVDFTYQVIKKFKLMANHYHYRT